jgi:WD40 repeat protein
MSEIQGAHWKDRLPFIETIVGVGDYWNITQKTVNEHRYSGKVKVVVFSPDGKSLATASDNAYPGDSESGDSESVDSNSEDPDFRDWGWTIRIWEPATGICRQRLRRRSHPVEVIAFSPDSKTLVSGSGDGTIQIWDATTGAHRQTLKRHSAPVNMIAFSPDSKLFALDLEDRIIELWDVATGMCQQTLSGDSNQLGAFAFSADGKILASCSDYYTIRIWDVTTGVCRQMHTNINLSQLPSSGQGGRAQLVAFSPDDQTLALGADDGSVLLWDITTGVCRRRLSETGGQVWAVAFSPDGKTLAAGLDDAKSARVVQLWDLVTGIYRGTVPIFSSNLELSFSEDSRYLKTNRELIRVPSTLVFSDDSHNHVLGVSWNGYMGCLMMDEKSVLPFSDYAMGDATTLCGDTVVFIPDESSGRPIFLRLNLCRV